VKLVIEAAGDLEVDAGFIVGNFGGKSVFFLDLDAELPVGIPIFLDIALRWRFWKPCRSGRSPSDPVP
jgi:hypothetical protein